MPPIFATFRPRQQRQRQITHAPPSTHHRARSRRMLIIIIWIRRRQIHHRVTMHLIAPSPPPQSATAARSQIRPIEKSLHYVYLPTSIWMQMSSMALFHRQSHQIRPIIIIIISIRWKRQSRPASTRIRSSSGCVLMRFVLVIFPRSVEKVVRSSLKSRHCRRLLFFSLSFFV